MGNFQKEKVKRFFLSLLIAMFIWGYVTNMHNPIQNKSIVNVPISIINTEALEAQNLAISTNSTYTTSVVVEGRFTEIQNVSAKDVEVILDLNDLALKEGVNHIPIVVKSLNNNIKIVKEKTPFQVKIDVVKLLQKEIPIFVNAIGDLDENYINGEAILSKEKAICSGTKESLSNVKYLLATVDLNGATEDISELIMLKAINQVGEEATNIILKDKEVEVTVPINFIKEVPIAIDIEKNVPYGHKLDKYTIDKTTVSIVGPKKVLDKIDKIYTEPLDLSRRYYDFDKRLNLVYPDSVSSRQNVVSVYGSFIVTKK